MRFDTWFLSQLVSQNFFKHSITTLSFILFYRDETEDSNKTRNMFVHATVNCINWRTFGVLRNLLLQHSNCSSSSCIGRKDHIICLFVQTIYPSDTGLKTIVSSISFEYYISYIKVCIDVRWVAQSGNTLFSRFQNRTISLCLREYTRFEQYIK